MSIANPKLSKLELFWCTVFAIIYLHVPNLNITASPLTFVFFKLLFVYDGHYFMC